MVLNELDTAAQTRNHVLVVIDPIPEARPPLTAVGVHESTWPPVPECRVMRRASRHIVMTCVVVAPELEAAVLRHCARWSPKETGGIIVGYRCDLAIHLTGFGGPGPRAKHARATEATLVGQKLRVRLIFAVGAT